MAVTARGKPARTRYRVIERFADATLLECRLETGRTHQIRVHMRAIGHPLVGDPTYGSRTTHGTDHASNHAPEERTQHPRPRPHSPPSRARRCTLRGSG